jgi:ribosomal protein S18 acetylase RimI-like enzyme
VAFDADEIAGAVLGYILPEENEAQGYRRGWVDPVFVRRPWRRRGLAGVLLGEALVRLRERGMTSAQLEVDSENANQALGLYERHGFAVDRSSSEWHKPIGGMDPRPTGDRRDELPG